MWGVRCGTHSHMRMGEVVAVVVGVVKEVAEGVLT